MARDNLWITLTVGLLTLGLWALANRPAEEPPWPRRIQGFSFQPLRADDDPALGLMPSTEEVASDLAFLRGRTHSVRTYSVDGVLGQVPELAAAQGINVAVGAWLYWDRAANERELGRLIEIVNDAPNAVRAVVGNETLLRSDLSPQELMGYLDRARAALTVPVSTAEPWHVWLRYPELADHVDYIAAHLLPYWEGIALDDSVEFIARSVKQLEERFPGKPVVLAEVGWPSNGRMRRGAAASDSNEAAFLRRFLERAAQERWVYYVMEAFDQPWKASSEGAVGSYWGVWDAERRAKFEFTAPIVYIPQWRLLAGLSVAVALGALALLLLDGGRLARRGRSFLALTAFGAATAVVWIAHDYFQQYLTPVSAGIGMLLLAGTGLIFLITLTEAHEWAESVWVRQRLRRPRLARTPAGGSTPFVSIHVPCYNEPPQLVIETLDQLAALDYPRFEVLVIDNNTVDPEVWEPVQHHCEKLGPRFRFFHVEKLAGYKAGALNFALERSSPAAELIAVIDSDYNVEPHWLADLVPQFASAKVAIVQAPQDYRDAERSAFKALCYAEYSGFFYFGMQTRNERNAIIQHGTMTLVRRSALASCGGWAQWCITEDAELGLRILEAGHEAIYVPRSYGRGLMPDTFLDYKLQRARWAYGAVRIMRAHAAALLGGRTRLTAGQRYHYVAGWMPWFADALNLLFALGAVLWSAAMVAAPTQIDPPGTAFSLLPVLVFAFRVSKTLYLYQGGLAATLRQTGAAVLAGLSLSHAIGMAMLAGLLGSSRPFFRTPKCARSQPLALALAATRGELCALTALWSSAAAVTWFGGPSGLELQLWVAMLLVLSLPYVAAVAVSWLSAQPQLSASWIGPMSMVDAVEGPPRPRARGGALSGAARELGSRALRSHG